MSVRQFIAFGSFPSAWKEPDLDGALAMVVKDSADIASRWPKLLAKKPDFVKLFLLYSEQYERRSNDVAKGLSRTDAARLLNARSPM